MHWSVKFVQPIIPAEKLDIYKKNMGVTLESTSFV